MSEMRDNFKDTSREDLITMLIEFRGRLRLKEAEATAWDRLADHLRESEEYRDPEEYKEIHREYNEETKEIKKRYKDNGFDL